MKRVEETSKSKAIGYVRIDAQELVDIIRSVVGDKVETTASNGEWEFSSLDDIEKNLQSLVGNPTIKIGALTLSLDTRYSEAGISYYTRFTEGGLSKEDYEELAESLATRLRPYSVYLANDIRQFNVAFWLSLTLVLLVLLYMLAAFPQYWANILGLSLLTLVGLHKTIRFVMNIVFGKHCVYFSSRQGFLARNQDKIAVGIIVGIVTSLAWNAPAILANAFSNQNGEEVTEQEVD